MPDLTPRIGIKKPLGNENVSRASFNENWDIIDAKVATLGLDGKVPSDQLPGQNGFANVSGKTGGTISTVVADSSADTLTIEGQGLIQVATDAATDTIILNTTAEVNQNAFSTVQVNGTNIVSDNKTDTLFINSGAGIAITPEAAIDAFTISIETPTWTNLVLQNGAAPSVFGGIPRTPRYTKIGKLVTLEGEILPIANGTQIATMPVGYRPAVTRIFKVALNYSITNDGATIFIEGGTGEVFMHVTPNQTQAISLMGISFYVD